VLFDYDFFFLQDTLLVVITRTCMHKASKHGHEMDTSSYKKWDYISLKIIMTPKRLFKIIYNIM